MAETTYRAPAVEGISTTDEASSNPPSPPSPPSPSSRPTRPAPSLTEIVSLAERLKRAYSAQDRYIERSRDDREMTSFIDIPDELRSVDLDFHDPTMTDEIARTTATLTRNLPVCIVASGPDDKSQRLKELMETVSEVTLWNAMRRIDGVHGYSALVDGCLGDGGAWCKVVPLWEEWGDVLGLSMDDFDDPDVYFAAREEQKKIASGEGRMTPVAIIPVDARCIYPVTEGHRIVKVVEITRRPTLDVAAEYGMAYSRRGGLRIGGPPMDERQARVLGDSVEQIELWDDTWCSIVIRGGGHGLILKQWEHGMGRHPYFSALGVMHSHWRNRKVGWGVGASKMSLVEFKSFLQTLIVNDAAQQVGRPVVRKRAPRIDANVGNSGQPTKPETWHYRTIIDIQPNEEIVEMPIGGSITPALQQTAEMVGRDLEKMTAPKVSGDIAGSGLEGAGFAMTTALGDAQLKNWPYIDSVQNMLADISRWTWHLLRDVIREPFYILYSSETAGLTREPTGPTRWIKVNPENLKPGLSVRWEIRIDQRAAEMLVGRYWREQVDAGFADMDEAIIAQGRNPAKVRLGRAMDRWRLSDIYNELQMREIVQTRGRGDLMKLAALRMAQEGGSPAMPALGLPPGAGAEPGLPGDQAALAASPGGGGFVRPGPRARPRLGRAPGGQVGESNPPARSLQPLIPFVTGGR